MTEPRTYRGRSVQDRRQDRRRQFCESGIELFGTRGYAATSVAAVCKHAALSSRQFYEEFEDREHLLRTIYDDAENAASTAVVAAVRDALAVASSIDTVLEAGIAEFVNHFSTDRRLTRICFVEAIGASPDFDAHRAQRRVLWVESLAAIASAGIERGLISQGSDPLLWTGFIGAVNAVIIEQVNSDVLTTDDTLRVMRTLLRRGMLG